MQRLKQLFIQFRETVAYIVFGGLTTLVNLIVYFICKDLFLLTPTWSNIAAWALSVLFAFITNKQFVFQSLHTSLKKTVSEFLSFVSMRLVSGVIDTLLVILFIEKLGYNDLVVKIASNILIIILNYIFSKFFIFRKK